ncbi:MAG: 4Fe-4S binding protein [Muribaculum sp.]|nr:4Fe-4S binding protein [Muribaculum sp.]
MNNIRVFRIFLAIVFFVASLAFLFLGPDVHPMVRVARDVQIVPTALSATTLGVTLFWFVFSFCFGRVYCSTVCPIGTVQDIAVWIRRRIPRLNRPFSFSMPRRWRYDILVLYLVCLLLSISVVCFIIEPWNMLANLAASVRPGDVDATWANLAYGVTGAIVSGAVSVTAIFVTAIFRGREYCNTVCPIGTALGIFNDRTLFHIEIDPDRCTNCMKCEDVCTSSCIKVVSRYVDNSRCVRCFDCLSVCGDDAIRFQINKNRRPATPLMRKSKKA